MSLPVHLQQYLTAFAKASAETGLDPLLIAALIDRESGGGLTINPPGPHGLGDDGHGHGLAQIDDRSWGKWLVTSHWWDPVVNICKGAEILNGNVIRFEKSFDPIFCGLASYNCGPGNVHAALNHMSSYLSDDAKRAHIDARTTGRNYATDVLQRFAAFKKEQP